MLILLVRHAQASERDPERWPDDTLRSLTNVGREAHAGITRALCRLDLYPEVLLTSPWKRAIQTANLMIEEMEVEIDATRCDALAAEPDLAKLQECIGTRTPDSVVALVGHSPWMEDLASLLLAGPGSRIAVDFPKSGVLAIQADRFEAGAGVLQFFLRPKQIRRLTRRKKGKR